MANKKVIIGMSGGVDSSVAAAVLLEKGYEVIGVTMKLWSGSFETEITNESGCCSLSAVEDARRVADNLGIPYYVMDFQEIFGQKVVDYFTEEYKKGRTPNPCIACNKHVKFDALLKKALAMNIDYVATGHYAKVEYDDNINRYLIKKSTAGKKDQTYALYNLTQEQLKHILMPLGDYTKEETRKIAKKIGLNVADKPDSQEICFIPDNNYVKFIEETGYTSKEGYFLNSNGEILGKHKGIINYTIGQRKGLGITFGKPMYVVSIDVDTANITLGEAGEQFSDSLIAFNPNFILFEKIEKPINVTAKIRYSAKEAQAVIEPMEEDKVFVKFNESQKAITPGQAIVFYQQDILVGGATIEKSI
jgi:tRNA-specific 2-thiouridylase